MERVLHEPLRLVLHLDPIDGRRVESRREARQRPPPVVRDVLESLAADVLLPQQPRNLRDVHPVALRARRDGVQVGVVGRDRVLGDLVAAVLRLVQLGVDHRLRHLLILLDGLDVDEGRVDVLADLQGRLGDAVANPHGEPMVEQPRVGDQLQPMGGVHRRALAQVEVDLLHDGAVARPQRLFVDRAVEDHAVADS